MLLGYERCGQEGQGGAKRGYFERSEGSTGLGTSWYNLCIWASIARYPPPPPTPWLWVCIVAPQYPPPPCGVGGGGWWWVVVYPPPPCGVGGVGGGGWWWWWWWKKLYMYVYECISTPLPPVVWVVWVVVGGGGGGGGRSCICMYMNVYVWYECIFLVFAYLIMI